LYRFLEKRELCKPGGGQKPALKMRIDCHG
jgi:hypothetical protein